MRVKSTGINFTQEVGVTSAQLQHAIAIANALPANLKQVLLAADGGTGVSVLLWPNGIPSFPNDAGENECPAPQPNPAYCAGQVRGQIDEGSGLADVSLVHELYEMAAKAAASLLAGSWDDPQAIALADAAMRGPMPGGNPGNLVDPIPGLIGGPGGQETGDGDLMSDSFVADFFATHPGLDQDQAGSGVLTATVLDAPVLVRYIAAAFGLTSAAGQPGAPTAPLSAGHLSHRCSGGGASNDPGRC